MDKNDATAAETPHNAALDGIDESAISFEPIRHPVSVRRTLRIRSNRLAETRSTWRFTGERIVGVIGGVILMVAPFIKPGMPLWFCILMPLVGLAIAAYCVDLMLTVPNYVFDLARGEIRHKHRLERTWHVVPLDDAIAVQLCWGYKWLAKSGGEYGVRRTAQVNLVLANRRRLNVGTFSNNDGRGAQEVAEKFAAKLAGFLSLPTLDHMVDGVA